MNNTGKNLKTLATNLQMEWVDELLAYHGKGNLCVDNVFKNRVLPHTLSLQQLQVLERSDYEISPFHDDEIYCDTVVKSVVRRERTALAFEDSLVNFSKIKSLLKNSFAANQSGARPYPSGGALYPVETICVIFAEKLNNSPPSGFYHYRPTLNVLQPIKTLPSEAMRKVLLHMELTKACAPAFALLYVGVVAKMLVKYRHRGYRYALMEAGSMYQQADLIGQSLGLRNKLYSGFNDHEILKLIGLDNMTFLPLVIQSFGGKTCR